MVKVTTSRSVFHLYMIQTIIWIWTLYQSYITLYNSSYSVLGNVGGYGSGGRVSRLSSSLS